MADPLTQLINTVEAHPFWPYATVFLAALLEAAPVLAALVVLAAIIWIVRCLRTLSAE